MENNKYNEVKKIVIDYITEVSFKPLLEDNQFIADLYDNKEITYEDFYNMVNEIKIDAMNNGFSDTITLTKDELNSFLQDWSAGYSAEEQYLSWDEKSMRIVNFLGLDNEF